MSTELTILNHYELTGPAEDFREAISRLAARVEAEGHKGIRAYRFFVNEAEGCARAVIDYETPDAWLGHHEIAMDWPEMKAMHAVARLSDVTFLGPLTPDIRAYLEGASITARIHSGNSFVAGFRRNWGSYQRP